MWYQWTDFDFKTIFYSILCYDKLLLFDYYDMILILHSCINHIIIYIYINYVPFRCEIPSKLHHPMNSQLYLAPYPPLEATLLGVPMIVTPFCVDQPTNGEALLLVLPMSSQFSRSWWRFVYMECYCMDYAFPVTRSWAGSIPLNGSRYVTNA